MGTIRLASRIRTRRVFGAAAALPMLAGPRSQAAAWEHPYSDATYSGNVIAQARWATSGSVSVPNIGSFVPGAGPVAAKDSTVYVRNKQRKVKAEALDGRFCSKKTCRVFDSIGCEM